MAKGQSSIQFQEQRDLIQDVGNGVFVHAREINEPRLFEKAETFVVRDWHPVTFAKSGAEDTRTPDAPRTS